MIRIGCINWDSIWSDTYFGGYTMRALSKFPERLPYNTEKTEDGYRFKNRSAEDYEKELQYAIDAGIDFFAHCWYAKAPVSESVFNPGTDNVGPHINELSGARFLHMKSPLREKIKLCAIIAAYEMPKSDYAELAAIMRESYYEKNSDGRPVVLVFGIFDPLAKQEIKKLKEFTDTLPKKPYLVGLCGNIKDQNKHLLEDYDALCAYAEIAEGINSYEELTDRNIISNFKRSEYGLPSVPLFTLGWNPRPRIKNPVPWTKYPDADYAEGVSDIEMLNAAKKLKESIKFSPERYNNDFIITYAGNEFEEGGWICPTLGSDGKPDLSRVNAFAKVSEILKN